MVETKMKGCRLRVSDAGRIEQAADEQEMVESEIIRRALRLYISQNPDGIQAFARSSGDSSTNQKESASLRNSSSKRELSASEQSVSSRSPQSNIYDVIRDVSSTRQ